MRVDCVGGEQRARQKRTDDCDNYIIILNAVCERAYTLYAGIELVELTERDWSCRA